MLDSSPGASAAVPDCRTCGACCVPEIPQPLYVGLGRSDLDRLTPRWRAQYVSRDAILTKLDRTGHCVCVALRGSVGERVSCAIYERRPDECRRLQAGSADCIKAREQAGLSAASA